MNQGKCHRYNALYRPGEALPGVAHHFVYSGSMPMTGRRYCTLCGAAEQCPEASSERYADEMPEDDVRFGDSPDY